MVGTTLRGRVHRGARDCERRSHTGAVRRQGKRYAEQARRHCGAGCALGDVGGEWIVWATGWAIGSTAELGPEYILDLPLAWIFGILFQYFVIAPLRNQVGELAPLGDAIKSDTLSVLSFEVGLFGWMAIEHYVIWNPPIDSSSHWFMMQIGMMLGFVTSWPVNRWLLRHGIKEPMPTV